jgi:hypothetical protein
MCISFYVWVFVKRSNFNSFVLKIKIKNVVSIEKQNSSNAKGIVGIN